MKLKVCGITTLEQLRQLQELDVDYAGLIFYEGSKRHAHEKLQAQSNQIRNLDIKKVGVFVNADMGFLKSLVQQYGLSAVQLHGDETPEYCALLGNEFVRMGSGTREIEIIKAIRVGVNTITTNDLTSAYQMCCDYFLFDTDTTAYGGSGQRFDWTILQKSIINKPFFLSGGIGPDDMSILKSFNHAFLHAIDVNSCFEVQPGIKDMGILKTFSNAFKQHAYE